MNYMTIADHYKRCYELHGDTHLGVDWTKYEDTFIRYQVMLDVIRNKQSISSFLDFGCGTAALLSYANVTNQSSHINYHGLDINEVFVKRCVEKFPNVPFYHTDILRGDSLQNFDYIVCNGTFTEKRELTHNEMWEFFTDVIKRLWSKTNVGLAFNLMSKHVDWERDDLFHVSLDELGWFLKSNLSKNFQIRYDYGLYEYTTYIYR